ncbi:MAG TPA: hypothetical protein VGN01_07025 [Acidobacteriaceae bacterium]|jgi:hypothetical protein
MMDRITEWIEMLLVNLGLALNKISPEQRTMVTLFLTSLLVAAVVARALQLAVLR